MNDSDAVECERRAFLLHAANAVLPGDPMSRGGRVPTNRTRAAVVSAHPDVTVAALTTLASAITPARCQWARYVGDDPVPLTCDRQSSWSVLYACTHFDVSKRYCDAHLRLEQHDYERDGIQGHECGCEMTFGMAPQ